MALTFAAMQPLLDQFRGDGLVASCYADLAIIAGTPARWPGAFKAKATAVKKMLADDPTAWRQFEENFQAIGNIVEAPQTRHAKGIAVFSAAQRGFFRSYPLDVPVENELVVHQAPYLVPLLQILCRQRHYLVVHTNTHQGRLLSATAGSLRLLEEIKGAVPKHQHSSGQRRGMEQATIAGHRDECVLHYQKKLGEAIDKLWAAHAFQGIILLGEHEQLEHLRKRLPPRLATRVICEEPHAWVDEPLAIADAVHGAQSEVVQAEEKRMLDTVADGTAWAMGSPWGPVLSSMPCKAANYVLVGLATLWWGLTPMRRWPAARLAGRSLSICPGPVRVAKVHVPMPICGKKRW